MAESYRERILRVFPDTECNDMGTPLFLPDGTDRRRESVRIDAVRGLLGRRGGRIKEILFRGKCTDNGEWVEGFFVKVGGYCYILTGKLNITNGHINFVKYEVDPETVGQYTGPTDKNGVKIFEGDIVKITDKYGKSVVYAVEFYMGAFVLRRMDVEYRLQFIDFPLRYYDFEILGNIHDNKELLKEGGAE